MQARIFLLPGFGENCSIYDPLLPSMEDYVIERVEYPDVLNQVSFLNYNGFRIVERIIAHYGIRPEDKLIGHSTGGYFAFLIREMMDNEICMISGFSDCSKIIHPLSQPWLTTPLLGITGFAKTAFARWHMLGKVKGKDVERPMKEAMLQMKAYSNMDLFKLSMMLAHDEKPLSVLENPLRIHAKNDKLVKLPDEDYVEVKGGHFPIALDTQGVLRAMRDFLKIL